MTGMQRGTYAKGKCRASSQISKLLGSCHAGSGARDRAHYKWPPTIRKSDRNPQKIIRRHEISGFGLPFNMNESKTAQLESEVEKEVRGFG